MHSAPTPPPSPARPPVPTRDDSFLVLPLEVMGAPVDVRLPGTAQAIHERLSTAWSRCLRRDMSPAAVQVSYTDGDLDRDDAVLSSVSTDVTISSIRAQLGERLMFHAAGLSDPATGLTSALVALSGTGKTTASCRLGRELGYVSDETVSVDAATLSVAGYPKPLSVIVDRALPKQQLSPDELGLRLAHPSTRLNRLFVLERRSDAEATGIGSSPLPLTRALELVVPNISALPSVDRPLSTLLDVVHRCGGVRQVVYSEIDHVAGELIEETARPSEPLPLPRLTAWSNPDRSCVSPEDAMSSSEPAPARFLDAPEGSRVDVGAWVEAVVNPEDESQLLVLLTHRITVLGGIGPQVFHEVRRRGPLTPDQVVDAVVAAHGPDPRARELVVQCLDALTDSGALRPVR